MKFCIPTVLNKSLPLTPNPIMNVFNDNFVLDEKLCGVSQRAAEYAKSMR